jgi:hypothetical protein
MQYLSYIYKYSNLIIKKTILDNCCLNLSQLLKYYLNVNKTNFRQVPIYHPFNLFSGFNLLQTIKYQHKFYVPIFEQIFIKTRTQT